MYILQLRSIYDDGRVYAVAHTNKIQKIFLLLEKEKTTPYQSLIDLKDKGLGIFNIESNLNGLEVNKFYKEGGPLEHFLPPREDLDYLEAGVVFKLDLEERLTKAIEKVKQEVIQAYKDTLINTLNLEKYYVEPTNTESDTTS